MDGLIRSLAEVSKSIRVGDGSKTQNIDLFLHKGAGRKALDAELGGVRPD